MIKINWKVGICFGGYSSVREHNIYFTKKTDAAKAKKFILAEVAVRIDERKNNAEDQYITVPHDMGELTFKLDRLNAEIIVHLWDAKTNKEHKSEDAKTNAILHAEIVAKTVAAAIKGSK